MKCTEWCTIKDSLVTNSKSSQSEDGDILVLRAERKGCDRGGRNARNANRIGG